MNSPELVVDRQLDAYNKGDYETFAACYHKDIISYRVESATRYDELSGKSFFEHYKKKFLKNPKIYCTVLQRIRHGQLIVDKECISNGEQAPYEELVIYEIENDLITKMWFCNEIPCNLELFPS